MLHLTAYNVIDGEILKASWVKIGIAAGVVVCASIAFALSSPDATELARWLKPWFADNPSQTD